MDTQWRHKSKKSENSQIQLEDFSEVGKPNNDIDYDQLWKCSNCKYENEKDETSCSACETAKPSKAFQGFKVHIYVTKNY